MVNEYLKYTGGKENFKQVLYSHLTDIEEHQAYVREALYLEFPQGTLVTFEYRKGTSHGEVVSHRLHGADARLSIRFHTGKTHSVAVTDILTVQQPELE